ncbi:T9SS type A sorting domain-containing protein [Flavobacterium humi]|uniref:T9SS type A sorting domain-containing protein n=1 Tax=Flavobacterium humi TaxID=2562683 RepID=A0A4Z0L3U2_9FLAO|nr:T9SS type A sorting domain-containing protein [Flavobacterium humi]TGD56915.1 T9SS type A sorting domain-containing protein [Flavobacterium humi]
MKKITLLAIWFFICCSANAQMILEGTTDYGKLQDVTYDANVQNKLYAATQGNHIVVSLDNGLNWNVLFSYPNSSAFIEDLRMLPGNNDLSFSIGGAICIYNLATNQITATFPVPQSGVPGAGLSRISSYYVRDAAGTTMLVDTTFKIGFAGFGKTFYTEDGGAHWQEIYYTVNNDNVFINNVAISPNNPKMLFLARGLGDSGIDGGLFISVNGGNSWQESLAGVSTEAIAFNPANGNEILVGSSIGFGIHPENLFKSTDNGLSWNALPITWTDETLNNITKIVYNDSNPNKIIVLDENEIVRSDDGGDTWTNVVYPVGISMVYYYGINASYNPVNENQVVITTDLYPQISNDGGATLTQIRAPFFNCVSTSIGKYATGSHLYYHAQGGRLHKNLQTNVTSAYDTELPNSFNPKRNYSVADPTIAGRVFTYASMGFFGGYLKVSNDYGATTTDLLQAFADDMQELTIDPNNSNVIYVSMRSTENSTVYKIDFSDLNNVVTTEITTPEVSEFGYGVVTGIIVGGANSEEMYIAKGTKVFKSVDGGVNWIEKISGLALNEGNDIIFDLVKNPFHANQLSVATNAGIYTTSDGAENWTLSMGSNVNRLKYSPINDGVIAAAAHTSALGEAAIYYSIDNGLTWSTVAAAQLNYAATGAVDFSFEGTTIDAYIGAVDLGVVKYSIINLPLSIKHPSSNGTLGLYPNPAVSEVTLSVPDTTQIQSVAVFSLLGQKVIESNTSRLNVSGLAVGTYVVKATTSSGNIFIQKMIVE